MRFCSGGGGENSRECKMWKVILDKMNYEINNELCEIGDCEQSELEEPKT